MQKGGSAVLEGGGPQAGCGDKERALVYTAPAGGSLPPRGRWLAAGETDEGRNPERLDQAQLNGKIFPLA